jgi:hypothetical protein
MQAHSYICKKNLREILNIYLKMVSRSWFPIIVFGTPIDNLPRHRKFLQKILYQV